MILELQRAVDDDVEVQGLFLRGSWTRKLEKILDDARGAASLAVRHFELALGVIVHALALAEEFAGTEDCSERIVQFVGDTREHLAHSREFFGLDELGFEALHFGDVPAGDDGAFDFSVFVEKRAEIAFQAAPFALLVSNANFDGGKVFLSRDQIVEEGQHRRAVINVGALAEGKANDFGTFVAEDFLEFGADEIVPALCVHNKNEVGETVHEAAGKFLLLVKLFLDGAALRDINERALETDHATTGVANGGGGVQTIDRLPVFAAQGEFVAVGTGFSTDFADDRGAL